MTRFIRALGLVLAVTAIGCGDQTVVDPGPGPSPVVPPDPVVIEGSQNVCVPVRDFYAMWTVRSTDGQVRAVEAVAYRDAAAGCDPTTGDAAALRPLWSPSGTEATFYLAPAAPTCGRAHLVLRVDGVQKATLTIDTGIACL